MADDPVSRLVAFGRELRTRGLPVGTGRILTFVRAVGALGPVDREGLYWAGRATLVSSRPTSTRSTPRSRSGIRTMAPEGGVRIELDLPAPAGADIDWGDLPAGTRGAAPGPRPRAGPAPARTRRSRGGERDPDRGQRRRGAAREVLRRAHAGGAGAGGRAGPPARRVACRASAPAARGRPRRAGVRRAPHAPAVAAHTGRAVRTGLARRVDLATGRSSCCST